ncbi:PUA-like domain-containing protein [Multifurca ochricompacta]|uniref:PUA-like domain-containing protein n=1 Tax=Multifurca ochricompacta TaxID=376703 RepID=A0AAD4QSV7_9AGAM|nr:PUA-like domain-containing protein [Multifurca ochricompacta]
MASHLVPLLHCPLCPPSSPLHSPVTLYCGHTIYRDPAAFATIPDTRTDITVNKLATIIQRYDQYQQSQSIERLPALDSASGSDSQTDDEIKPFISPQSVDTISSSSTSDTTSFPRQVSPDSSSQQGPPRLNTRKRRRKHLPPPRRPEPPFQSANQFEKELLTELTCEICFMLLYQPITSPCQHTFCSKCLHRSLDHGNQCPLCRQDLPGFSYFQDHPFNKTIISIVLKTFPEAYAERGRVIEQEERHARLDTPIFVCQLSFPGLPTILHFFEPRYRLMLRRCLEKPNPSFGMIMPPSAAGGRSAGNDFGTMLEIKSVRMLPDGRSMVETRGTYSFRIMERGTMDGYMVGRIERIFDYPSLYPDIPGDASSIPPPIPSVTNAEADVQITLNAASDAIPSSAASEAGPSRPYSQQLQELVDVCLAFLDQIQRGAAPWVVQRLNRLNQIYGPMPTDPAHFSYWMAMALPIEDMEKAKLLPVKSPLLRLRLVVHWIEQLNSNWWFTNGCIVS